MEDGAAVSVQTGSARCVLVSVDDALLWPAELRAHVFQAIEEQESVSARGGGGGDAETATARRLRGLTATPAASLVLDLVREWLDFYELDYTSSTLTAEARLGAQGSGHGHGSPTAPRDRAALSQALHLPPPSDQRPLLLDLLLQMQGQGQTLMPPRVVPTHSPSNSYSDERAFIEQPRASVPPPLTSSASDAEQELLSAPSGRLALSRRSGEGDSMMGGSAYKTMQASSTSPRGGAHSPTDTSPHHSAANAPASSGSPTSAGAGAPASDASAGAGASGRRRRDRNLDMAAVHTLVQAPSPSNAAAAAAAAASTAASASAVPSAFSGSLSSSSSSSLSSLTSSSSSSLSKLAPLPSLALNRSAPLPPVEVPFIDLDGSSDADASTSAADLDARAARPGVAAGGGSKGRGHSFSGDEQSADEDEEEEANSLEMDHKRLEEVNRMIRSYEQQGKMARADESASHNTSKSVSQSNSRVQSASQSLDNYDEVNTSGGGGGGGGAHSRPSDSLAPPPDEDEYADEEFAASDVGGGSGIEESLEVEEEESMGGGGGGTGGGAGGGTGRGVEDSLDAEYFASNSSLIDQGRKHSLHPLSGGGAGAGRRAHMSHIASHSSAEEESMDARSIDRVEEGSHHDLQASMEPDQYEHEQEQEQQRDLADVYSEDQSVNEPLDQDWDYTEEVEVVRR